MFKIATYYETRAVCEYDSYLILMIAQKQLKGGIMCWCQLATHIIALQ